MPLVLLASLWVSSVSAHEFWIEPESYRLQPGDALLAATRTGTDFAGGSAPFVDAWFVSLQLFNAVDDQMGGTAITGRAGDVPAIRVSATQPGLNILTYHSSNSRIEYVGWKKFATFLHKEGVSWVIDQHRRRGLREHDIIEVYTRYAKSLVQVGSIVPGDIDRRTGMPYEIVVNGNPYDQSRRPTADLSVTVFRDDAPLAGAQVSIFHKPVGKSVSSARRTVLTDSKGQARISFSGAGAYLLSAVDMTPASESIASRSGAVWHSHWASVTYQLAAPE